MKKSTHTIATARFFATATASGPARSRSSAATTVDSLLRVSQACETLLAGFESGQAVTVKSCLVFGDRDVAVSDAARRNSSFSSQGTAGGDRRPLPPRDFLPRVSIGIFWMYIRLQVSTDDFMAMRGQGR